LFGSLPNVSAIGWCATALRQEGEVTYEVVGTLKKRLEVAQEKWGKMGLSMTPKWHMLLNLAIKFLIRNGGGVIEMGKY
jgi:hypothetical protein